MLPANLPIHPKVRNLFLDSAGKWIPSTYKVLYGGRGGLKSWGFAQMAVLLAYGKPTRFLCTRELQNSIADSVHFLLKSQIDSFGLSQYFSVLKSTITCDNGSEFIFTGLRDNPDSVKSKEAIDVCWIEEASALSESSWQALTPTVLRANEKCEIWVSFNPDLEKDPVSKRFILDPMPNARIVRTNWRDNPWLTKAMIAEKDYLAKVDPDSFQHVWEGDFRRNGAAQVLRGKVSIEAFDVWRTENGKPLKDADWEGPYLGVDFGYSVDPSAMVKCWIRGRNLYIEHEAYGHQVSTDKLPALFDLDVPRARDYVSRADCARPETIDYLRRHGYGRMISADKWPGCVEDGVEYLRQFEKIIAHPRCEQWIQESRLWQWKVDAKSKDILPDLLDKHNHLMDATRYALGPMIKKRPPAGYERINHMGR